MAEAAHRDGRGGVGAREVVEQGLHGPDVVGFEVILEREVRGNALTPREGQIEARGDLIHERLVVPANGGVEEAGKDVAHGRPPAAHCTPLRLR